MLARVHQVICDRRRVGRGAAPRQKSAITRVEGEQRSEIRVARGETHKSRHHGRVISIYLDGEPIGTRGQLRLNGADRSDRSDSYKSELRGSGYLFFQNAADFSARCTREVAHKYSAATRLLHMYARARQP